MPSRPWLDMRAAYVEGVATDPDGDPTARTWPSLDEVGALFGVPPQTVRARSTREHWVALRTEFQRDLDRERRQQVIAARSERVAAIEGTALGNVQAGTVLVQRRLSYLVGQHRTGDRLDASELAALGLAQRRWLQVEGQILGRPDDTGDGELLLSERDAQVAEAALAARIMARVERAAADAGVDLPN